MGSGSLAVSHLRILDECPAYVVPLGKENRHLKKSWNSTFFFLLNVSETVQWIAMKVSTIAHISQMITDFGDSLAFLLAQPCS